jgi:hypothetical protein
MLSREGARGQEFNAWGRPTNPPEHLTILPFTRLLAGPMDFTPGIFDLTFGKSMLTERVQSTLATQLALYVLIYSPVQMAADLPENYEMRPDAFQFIRCTTDWETSRTLQARSATPGVGASSLARPTGTGRHHRRMARTLISARLSRTRPGAEKHRSSATRPMRISVQAHRAGDRKRRDGERPIAVALTPGTDSWCGARSAVTCGREHGDAGEEPGRRR